MVKKTKNKNWWQVATDTCPQAGIENVDSGENACS